MTIHDFQLTAPPLEDIKDVGNTGEFFAEFIDLLQYALAQQKIDDKKSDKIVSHLVYKLAETFAGEPFYISRKPTIFAKQMAMYADLKRMKSSDVDKKYGVSKGYSLKIKKMIDDKRFHREQLKLF